MKQVLLAILIYGTLTACQTKHDPLKPNITGRTGEVLVVIDDVVKKDSAGILIRKMLTQPYLGLPQEEPFFNMLTTPHRYFEKQMMYFRNILVVEIDKETKTDTVLFYDAPWAKQQAVAKLVSKNLNGITRLVHENEIRLIGFFNRAERNRIISINKTTNHTVLTNQIASQWQISLAVPTNFRQNKGSNQFTWFSQETPTSSMGIMIYGFDYAGPHTLDKDFLLNKRDSTLRFNVPGPVAGSFMSTELQADLIYKSEVIDQIHVAEIRGLWKTVGYAMGGPFLMRAHYNPSTGKVVVTDGYVFYPEKPEKRNMMRQLEGVMHTFSFVTPKP